MGICSTSLWGGIQCSEQVSARYVMGSLNEQRSPPGIVDRPLTEGFRVSRLRRTLVLLFCVEYHWEQVSQYASHNPDDE
ncbi:hypothetical protein SAMN05216403_101121 [Nitrosospira multiformis ATCC 25196]|uniref:Uncharacterized protein n=1 Tax=Nitrosospira multiformis (strain ATCC 25196 / NCIMB 11849 / C 71) TaxID=323848 RepID=A0A1H5RRX0_NITMU|nr:hypothetical protein SAMN05216411_101205 [Nitrosospira multiformis]SEF40261.1 hypothetical protein SAMN05216403_101121 [Nitrosospira multiformis ATCC 25196]